MKMQVEQHKSYQFVDFLKFFFCLCVVAIHTSVFPEFGGASAVLRLAVPFFFITSGFFFGRKVINSEKTEIWQITKRYCLRLLKIFIFFSAVNIIEHVWLQLYRGTPVSEILKKEISYILFYPRGALWYVAACMIGVLLLVPFLKEKKLNVALCIGVILYGFLLICNNYFFLINNTRIELFVNFYLKYFIKHFFHNY